MHSSTLPSTLCWAFLAASGLAQAASTLLPLTPGSYVVSSYKPCEEAPLAGVRNFDGKGLSGPHESNCTSTVLSHRGKTYQISTECRAYGDGTPETPTTTKETVQIKSPSSLVRTVHQEQVEYALCPKFH